MSGRYAKGTDVSAERTRGEIENVLARYGADAFAYAIDGRHARIAFRMSGRHFRFSLMLPDPQRQDFHTYKQGSTTFSRADGVPRKMWEQECRSSWRALLLVIKAKLEAASIGITTLEDEFLAHMVLPDGQTMGEWAKPEIERAYIEGKMPKQLQLTGPNE